MIFNYFTERRYKKRLKNEQLLKTIYHELGHLYIALLFDVDFPITQVIIGKKLTKKNSTAINSNGAVGYFINYNDLSSSIDLRDKLILILFGGMCSQNLHFSKKEEFEEKIASFISSPDINMNNNGGVQDFEIAKNFMNINRRYTGKTHKEYLNEILKFNFDYLSNDDVWSSIELFATEILRKRKLILNREEIFEIIEKLEFTPYLKSQRQLISTTRYPIAYSLFKRK